MDVAAYDHAAIVEPPQRLGNVAIAGARGIHVRSGVENQKMRLLRANARPLRRIGCNRKILYQVVLCIKIDVPVLAIDIFGGREDILLQARDHAVVDGKRRG